jgi:hypothetical protein
MLPVTTPPAPPPPPKPTEPPPPATTRYAIEETCGSTGVTLLDAADAVEVPLALVAVIVNVYEVPAVNPETVIGLAPVPVNDPGEDVAV